MKKHAAKRIDAGHYEYRGFVIKDTQGSGRLQTVMAFRRWAITKPHANPFLGERVAASWSLADAKKVVDALLDKKE